MSRMVVTAFAAVVGNGSPLRTAPANARSCHANVVLAAASRPPAAASGRSAACSSLTTDPPRVTISRPSCAATKFRSHKVPWEPMTCRSARNSPSRVKSDSNQPVRAEAPGPPEVPGPNATRAAVARSVTRSGSGSATAPVTDGSPAPAAEPTSRRQSIA